MNNKKIQPHHLFWTFGNHEPISMYRRIGRKSTGGVEGSALWLEKWHNWYDSEKCAKIIHNLGFNILHSRFYKGMGWDVEKKDFPDVKRFVRNCHKHQIQVLAYVQFSSLYYEVMQAEVPNLKEWAALDEHGNIPKYHDDSYWRWLPCINNAEFIDYLKKVITIALREGEFDGILFDNAFVYNCCCAKCKNDFIEHLKKIPDLEERFGIPFADFIELPPSSHNPEIKDPVYQELMNYRNKKTYQVFSELYDHIKNVKNQALVTANIGHLYSKEQFDLKNIDLSLLKDCFDIVVAQSGNHPAIEKNVIINQVRHLKLARAMEFNIFALSDSDAGCHDVADSGYLTALLEQLIFNGIPYDRTIMSPPKGKTVKEDLIKARQPLLKTFYKLTQQYDEVFQAPAYAPVAILHSFDSMKYSRQAFEMFLSIEEILLRNHIPYQVITTDSRNGLTIRNDFELLLIANQSCLSDQEINQVVKLAEQGKKILLSGNSGDCDEYYRQRAGNAFSKFSATDNIHTLNVNVIPHIMNCDWTLKLQTPAGARKFIGEFNKYYSENINISAPEEVFIEIKQLNNGDKVIFLLDYCNERILKNISVSFNDIPEKLKFTEPFLTSEQQTIKTDNKNSNTFLLPDFKKFAILYIL